MKIQIIAPALPPRVDGIGDYTANLAAELAKSNAVTILAGEGQEYTPIAGVKIEPVFRVSEPKSLSKIAAYVEAEQPDWLLLQYQPFCYGKWGLNPYLPLAIRSLKRRCPNTQFGLMAHELYVPADSLKNRVMTLWQRWQLRHLGNSADVVFVSIEAWANRLQGWFPKKRVVHLPVGSNIPRVEISRVEARNRLGIADSTFVVGIFGTAHPSRMLHYVRGAGEAIVATGREALVLSLGPQPDKTRAALGKLPLRADGALSAEDVSRCLAAMDLYLTPFDDGISTRRGSVMAGLQHGLPIVGTSGYLTDTLLKGEDGKAFLLSEVGEPEQFNALAVSLAGNAEKRDALSHHALELFESQFSWPRIASELTQALS